MSTVSEEEQRLLRQQVSARLQEHRRRRPPVDGAPHTHTQAALPGIGVPVVTSRRQSRVADSVAARFAGTVSYREFLAGEAEAALRQAEAAAEVARRTAEAVADAQRRLLDEIDQWNRPSEHSAANPSANLAASPAGDVPVVPRIEEQRTGVTIAISPASDLLSSGPGNARRRNPPATAHGNPLVEGASEVTEPIIPELTPEPTVALPTNLIEFPRQLVAARKARPRLAEGPLREDADLAPERAQLRIFEVEADAFSIVPAAPESLSPEWSSIRLDSWLEPHDTTQPQAQVSVTLPLFTAPVSQRVMALSVDLCCIGTAFLLAVAAAAYTAPELPSGKFASIAAAGTLLLFGTLYLLLCFTFSNATPGMRYARIGLCTFNDENPTRSAMRRRLFAMVLSAVPMGLGFAWAMLDDDRLSWHDRISRIYQRGY